MAFPAASTCCSPPSPSLPPGSPRIPVLIQAPALSPPFRKEPGRALYGSRLLTSFQQIPRSLVGSMVRLRGSHSLAASRSRVQANLKADISYAKRKTTKPKKIALVLSVRIVLSLNSELSTYRYKCTSFPSQFRIDFITSQLAY